MLVRAGSSSSNCTGFAGLLLDDDSPVADHATGHKLTDPNFDDVAASQLAVDREVEQRSIAEPTLAV
jgi:hypothetical protein